MLPDAPVEAPPEAPEELLPVPLDAVAMVVPAAPLAVVAALAVDVEDVLDVLVAALAVVAPTAVAEVVLLALAVPWLPLADPLVPAPAPNEPAGLVEEQPSARVIAGPKSNTSAHRRGMAVSKSEGVGYHVDSMGVEASG